MNKSHSNLMKHLSEKENMDITLLGEVQRVTKRRIKTTRNTPTFPRMFYDMFITNADVSDPLRDPSSVWKIEMVRG